MTGSTAVPAASAQIRALDLPFDAYDLSQLDHLTIAYAKDILIRDCMQVKGMSWAMLPPPPKEDPDPLARRRYGVIEPAIAARFGYHRPPEPDDAVWQQRDRLPAAERSAA